MTHIHVCVWTDVCPHNATHAHTSVHVSCTHCLWAQQPGTLSDPCIIGKKIPLPPSPAPHTPSRALRPEKILLSPVSADPHPPVSLMVMDTWAYLTPGWSYLQQQTAQSEPKPPPSLYELCLTPEKTRAGADGAGSSSCKLLSVFICTRQELSCCWFRATATSASDKWTGLWWRALFAISSCWTGPDCTFGFCPLLYSPQSKAYSLSWFWGRHCCRFRNPVWSRGLQPY